MIAVRPFLRLAGRPKGKPPERIDADWKRRVAAWLTDNGKSELWLAEQPGVDRTAVLYMLGPKCQTTAYAPQIFLITGVATPGLAAYSPKVIGLLRMAVKIEKLSEPALDSQIERITEDYQDLEKSVNKPRNRKP